jgi:hypothetical protein
MSSNARKSLMYLHPQRHAQKAAERIGFLRVQISAKIILNVAICKLVREVRI